MIGHSGSDLYEFDEYRVDPLKRRLLRGREVVPLTPKAFSILLVLLENRGQMVEKKDLVAKVWADSYVTEANLTQNISSLRKALGERAGEARYVVTIPGRGYCFTADVALVDREPTGSFQIPVFPPAPSLDDTLSRLPEPAVLPEPGRVRRRRLWLVSILVLALAGVTGAAYLLLQDRQPAETPEQAGTAQPRRWAVAVLGFRNLSGNRSVDWLADALTEMLTTELAAGSQVRVVAGENVEQVRQSLSPQQADSLARQDLERLYSRLGADMVVTGSYIVLPAGSSRRIRLDLRILKLPSGEAATIPAQVADEAALFDLVSRSGAELRLALGVSDLSPAQQQEARALHPATAEAARLYTQGLARLHSSDPLAAQDLLLQAVERDPNSASIHSALAEVWSTIGYDARAMEEARKAVELSKLLAREEQLAIKARFEEVSKHWAEAARLYRSLWTFFPDDLELGLHLALNLSLAGRGAEALQILAELRQLPPPAGEDARIDLTEARTALRLSDFVRVRQAAKAAAEKASRSGATTILVQALAYEGDVLRQEGHREQAVMILRKARDLAREARNPFTLGMALSILGRALQSTGDIDGAMEAQTEALEIAHQIGSLLGIASQTQMLGELYRSRGSFDRALSLLEKSLAAFGEIDDLWRQAGILRVIGSLLSLRGDLKGAQRRFEQSVDIALKMGNRLEEANARAALGSTLVRQGGLAGGRRELQKALELLRDAKQGAAAADATSNIHLELARLSLAEGDPSTASRLAREVTLQTGAATEPGTRARALALLAEALLRQRDLSKAREAADQARAIMDKGKDIELRLALAPALARVDAAVGAAEKAISDLRQALGEAEKGGLLQSVFELRLALGQIQLGQLGRGNPAAGRSTLQALREEAASRGYRTLEREAAAALKE